MKKLCILVLLIMANQAFAVDGISIEYGRGNMVEMSHVGINFSQAYFIYHF